MAGFELAGVARSAGEALRLSPRTPAVDLVLLDMHLPDGHGLGLLQRLRAAGHLCDVIAVTSARDTEVVRRAVSQGVVLYLLKPFSFADVPRQARAVRRVPRAARAGIDDDVVQDDVDQVFGALRGRPGGAELPKGLEPGPAPDHRGPARADPRACRPTEVGEAIGASRVTARRYLEHLADQGQVERSPRYGGTGRPEVAYAWRR